MTIESLVLCNNCDSLFHDNCIVNLNNCSCGFNDFTSENDIDKKSQKYIDIYSTKKTEYTPTFYDYIRGICRVPALMYHFCRFYLNYLVGNYERNIFLTFLRGVTKTLNINIKPFGLNFINPNVKKIYVGNHVGYHDAFILPQFIDTGVVASVSAHSNIVGRMMTQYNKTLMIKRGETNGIVEQMEMFMDKPENSALFIFPQGIFGQKDTLTKFRTGGFATKYPVQPVIVKYKQDVSSMSILHMLMLDKLDVELHVMDIQYKEENMNAKDYAESVRKSMAKYTGFLLSNIDSHDAKD